MNDKYSCDICHGLVEDSDLYKVSTDKVNLIGHDHCIKNHIKKLGLTESSALQNKQKISFLVG